MAPNSTNRSVRHIFFFFWHKILMVSSLIGNTIVAGPHTLTADEIFEGYVLPKGTMIIPNVWYVRPLVKPNGILNVTTSDFRGVMHDKQNFSNPMEFIPERFLDSEERGYHVAKLESVLDPQLVILAV